MKVGIGAKEPSDEIRAELPLTLGMADLSEVSDDDLGLGIRRQHFLQRVKRMVLRLVMDDESNARFRRQFEQPPSLFAVEGNIRFAVGAISLHIRFDM